MKKIEQMYKDVFDYHEKLRFNTIEEAWKRKARADEPPIAAGVKSSAQTGRSGQKESTSAAGGAKGDLDVQFALPEASTPGDMTFEKMKAFMERLKELDCHPVGSVEFMKQFEECQNTVMPELHECSDYESTFSDLAVTIEELQKHIDDIKAYLGI